MVERERDAYHSDNGCKGEEIHFFSLVLANMEGGAELKWRQSSLPVYFPESRHLPMHSRHVIALRNRWDLCVTDKFQLTRFRFRGKEGSRLGSLSCAVRSSQRGILRPSPPLPQTAAPVKDF